MKPAARELDTSDHALRPQIAHLARDPAVGRVAGEAKVALPEHDVLEEPRRHGGTKNQTAACHLKCYPRLEVVAGQVEHKGPRGVGPRHLPWNAMDSPDCTPPRGLRA